MRLIFQAAALADLRNIHDYIAKDNPAVAVSVISRIKSSLDRLLLFPRSGRVGAVEETFEVVVPGLPYIVVYQILTEHIEVVGVFHGAQDR
jgi:plasmid stabilization system protein ParE